MNAFDRFDAVELKDTQGDPIRVTTFCGLVYVNFQSDGRVIDMELTPQKARRLAKAIKRAGCTVRK